MTIDRIIVDQEQMGGQPCIRNTRLTVRRVVELVAMYPPRADLLRDYPELDEDDIRWALAYAAASTEEGNLTITMLPSTPARAEGPYAGLRKHVLLAGAAGLLVSVILVWLTTSLL